MTEPNVKWMRRIDSHEHQRDIALNGHQEIVELILALTYATYRSAFSQD